MKNRRMVKNIIAATAMALMTAGACFLSSNSSTLAALDTALQKNCIERVSIGSLFWTFRTAGNDYIVFVPPSRLQQTFTAAFGSVKQVEYNDDLDYWFLLGACMVPSLTLCTISGRWLVYPWLIAPACMFSVIYLLGLGFEFHSNQTRMTIQVRPLLNAIAVESWPIDGSYPRVWVSHFRGMNVCTHETSTCAGHLCDEHCLDRAMTLRRVPADEMFPFDSITD